MDFEALEPRLLCKHTHHGHHVATLQHLITVLREAKHTAVLHHTATAKHSATVHHHHVVTKHGANPDVKYVAHDGLVQSVILGKVKPKSFE